MPNHGAIPAAGALLEPKNAGEAEMSDTPRTDAITKRIFTSEINAEEYLKVATFARQLERALQSIIDSPPGSAHRIARQALGEKE